VSTWEEAYLEELMRNTGRRCALYMGREVCIDTKKHGMRAICSSLAPRLVNAGRLRRIYCQPFEGDCIDRTGGTTGVRCNVMGIRSPLTTAITA